MRIHINRERGGVLVQVVVALVVLFGFTALTTDYGMMAVRQRKLQSATDAAALAAGPEMHTATSEAAVQMAIRYAGANTADLDRLDFDWTAAHRLRVTAWDEVPTPFLSVLDGRHDSRRVSAVAEVEAFTPTTIQVTSKLRPWGIPIGYFDPNNSALSPIQFNEDVTLYLVSNVDEQPSGVPDNTYFVQPFALQKDRRDPADGDFPNYTHDVKYGYDKPISVTKKKSEPGYLDSFLWSQPGAWQDILNATYQAVMADVDSLVNRASQHEDYRHDTAESFNPDNPRVVFLPIYDRAIHGSSGGDVRAAILGFTAFYVEGMTGNAITGRFVRYSLPYDGRTLNPVMVEQLYSGIIQFHLVR